MMFQQIFILIIMTMLSTGMNTDENSSSSKVMDRNEHHVILQVSKADSAEQLVIVSQVRNILKSLPGARIKVVAHSQGLPLLVASQSKVSIHVKELIEQDVIRLDL